MSQGDFFQENRQAIYLALPHGTITTLAKAFLKNRIAIERMFQFGWEPEVHPDLLRRSMLLIEAASTNNDLVREYKVLFPEIAQREVLAL
jgi:hypothetical protein